VLSVGDAIVEIGVLFSCVGWVFPDFPAVDVS
jgi:hypothetical protein